MARDDAARRRRRPADQDHRSLALDRGRRAGGRTLHRRPRGAGRRRRASVHADRRLRHEHRHGRRLQPRLEARRAGAGLGRRRTCCNPTRPSAGRSPSATPSRPANSTSSLPACRRSTGDRARTRPQAKRPRREVSAHLATMGEEYASIGVQLGARYDGSPIIAGDGAPPADDYVRYTPSGVPGGRAPHYWLGRGTRLWRLAVRPVGRGLHAAAARRQGRRTARAIEAAAQQRGVPLKVLDVPQADARDLYGARSRAGPARPICRLARQCAAGRSRPAAGACRRGLNAPQPKRDSCHARRCAKLTFGRSARQSVRKYPVQAPESLSEDRSHAESSCP